MASKPVTPPRLVIIEGKDKGKVIPLKAGTVIIGRSKGDVLVHDPRISRSHVAVHFDDKTGKLTFTDLKSLNGTQINGETLQKGDLSDGDKLQLGNTLFDCQKFSEADAHDLTELNEAPPQKISKPEKRISAKAEAKAPEEPLLEEDTNASVSEVSTTDASQTGIPAEPAAWREVEAETPKDEITNHDEVVVAKARNPQKIFARIPKAARAATLALVAVIGVMMLMKSPSAPDPKEIDGKIASIRKSFNDKNAEGALKEALELTKSFPDSAPAWMVLGELYQVQNNLEQAIAAYRKAASTTPSQPLAHTRLIRLLMYTGLVDEALKESAAADRLIQEGVQSKQFFTELAQNYIDYKELKQPPEKLLILAKTLQTSLAPESTVGYKLEAQALFQQNRPTEALATLQAATKIDSNDEWVIENIAFAKLSMEDTNGATEVVEQWIKLKPNATKALLVMAYLKFNNKNFLGALPYVQRIVTIATANPSEPHYAEALSLAGQIYYQQNQTNEAETYLKQSCEMGFARSCEHPLISSKLPASSEEKSESREERPPVQPR